MIKYEITVSKDFHRVMARYNLEVSSGSPERIATFSLYVDGKDIIKENASENTKFFGTAFTIVNEIRDIDVSFTITSNKDFSADGSDTLRGGHPYDGTRFSN